MKTGANVPGIAEKARRCYEKLFEPLRQVAFNCGYNLVVHGSIARDIDLIAIPWVQSAAEPPALAEALRRKAEEINGFAYNADKSGAATPAYFDNGCPGAKPHGRLVWTFHLGGGPYLDLSVMPLRLDD